MSNNYATRGASALTDAERDEIERKKIAAENRKVSNKKAVVSNLNEHQHLIARYIGEERPTMTMEEQLCTLRQVDSLCHLLADCIAEGVYLKLGNGKVTEKNKIPEDFKQAVKTYVYDEAYGYSLRDNPHWVMSLVNVVAERIGRDLPQYNRFMNDVLKRAKG